MSGGITDAEANAKNRAWRVFKFWLSPKHRADVERMIASDVAAKFPPLDKAEIADTLRMRLITLRKCEAEGKPPPSIL